MGAALRHPVLSQNLQRMGSKFLRVGATEMQGYRVTMEDRHTIELEVQNHKDLALLGVFDGHGGDQAAIYLGDHLSAHVGNMEDPENAEQLRKTCMTVDQDFMDSHPNTKEHGSTCVFAVIRKPQADDSSPQRWRITVANVGDSRAILIRKDGTFVELSHDHKPQDEEECARIVRAGGHTSYNRVDGNLALSRAVGDYQYKSDPSLPVHEQKVIPVPDVMKGEAYSGDALLLCCDGLVEALTNAQVVTLARGEMKQFPTDPARVMERLVRHSLAAGSNDNHSAMICLFDDWSSRDTPEDEFYSSRGTNQFKAGVFHEFAEDPKFRRAYLADAARHGVGGNDLMTRAARATLEEDSMPQRAKGADAGPASGAPGEAPCVSREQFQMYARATLASTEEGPAREAARQRLLELFKQLQSTGFIETRPRRRMKWLFVALAVLFVAFLVGSVVQWAGSTGQTLSVKKISAFYDGIGGVLDRTLAEHVEAPLLVNLLDHAALEGSSSSSLVVFELGCGEGVLAEQILQRAPSSAQYTGVDVSRRRVAAARTRLRSPFGVRANIRLSEGAVEQPDFADASVDRFVATFVLDLLSEAQIEAALNEATRMVRPGGLLLLANLSLGSSPFTGAVSKIWQFLWTHVSASMLGGCRPLDAGALLQKGTREAQWSIEWKKSQWGFPAEALVARRRGKIE